MQWIPPSCLLRGPHSKWAQAHLLECCSGFALRSLLGAQPQHSPGKTDCIWLGFQAVQGERGERGADLIHPDLAPSWLIMHEMPRHQNCDEPRGLKGWKVQRT